MVEKIKIRWKEGVGLFIFLIFSGLYLFNDFSISIPGYFAFLDFLNFGDKDYWATLLNAFQEIILPAPILVGVFLYSLYKTEKNIKEGGVVFFKNLERSLIIALASVFAWSLLTFFSIDYVSYRSDNAVIPLFVFSYLWMIPIAPIVLAFLISFIPSLLLRVFYQNQKKFYASVVGFFALLFLGLLAYQQVSLKNCNFNRDEHCLANMAIKMNDISFCDKAKSDKQKNICLKIIERKNNKNEKQENKNTNKTVSIKGIISEDQKSISYDLVFDEIIKKDVDKIFPPTKYDLSVVVPSVFSYIPEHGKIILYRYVDGTEILLDAYVFDIKTETIKKLTNLNLYKYIYGGESLGYYSQSRFSPNGNMVVFNNGEEISVFDFVNDKEINVAKVNNENERLLSSIGEINEAKDDNFTWLNENTLQYAVYDRNTDKLLDVNSFHF